MRSWCQEKSNKWLQHHIQQPRFDFLLDGVAETQRNSLVGTYMTINGHYLGFGFWRTSPHRISALSRGGDWVCTGAAALTRTKLYLF